MCNDQAEGGQNGETNADPRQNVWVTIAKACVLFENRFPGQEVRVDIEKTAFRVLNKMPQSHTNCEQEYWKKNY